MSGRFKNALIKVPQTKPSCTAIVSQLTLESLKFHSVRNAGTTAAALNQSDIPSSSASDNKTSARHLADDGFVDSDLVSLARSIDDDRREYYKSKTAGPKTCRRFELIDRDLYRYG